MLRLLVFVATAVWALSACGDGRPTIAYDAAYCIRENGGAQSSDCQLSRLVFFRADGRVERFVPSIAADDSAPFFPMGHVDGNQLYEVTAEERTDDSEYVTLHNGGDDLKMKNPGQSGIAATLTLDSGANAKRIERYLAELAKLKDAPEKTPSSRGYLDQPMCYRERIYRDGRQHGEQFSCGKGRATFFSSLDKQIVEVDIYADPETSRGAQLWTANKTWTRRNRIVRPARYNDFTWSLSDEGYPQTAVKDVTPRGPVYYRQGVALAYPFYEGADLDEIKRIYSETVLPGLRRQVLLAKYFPKNSGR